MYLSIGKYIFFMETQIIFIDKSTSLYYDTVGGDIVSISASIKALLNLRGLKQADLMEVLKVGSKQALSNKFVGGRWSAADLVAVAEFCGCRLAFVLDDRTILPISAADPAGAVPVQAAPLPSGNMAKWDPSAGVMSSCTLEQEKRVSENFGKPKKDKS